MIGDEIYHHVLLIMREYGDDAKAGKINSRKWVEEQCETFPGRNGEDWRPIAVSPRYLCVKGAALKHVLAGPYAIFEILMEVNREQKTPRLKLRIGATGHKGSYGTLHIMTHSIEGIVGKDP